MYHKRLNVSNVSIPEEATHQRCSVQKAVLKNFALSIGKPLRWTLFLIELQVFRPQHRCFPVKFQKFLITAILKNIRERLAASVGASKQNKSSSLSKRYTNTVNSIQFNPLVLILANSDKQYIIGVVLGLFHLTLSCLHIFSQIFIRSFRHCKMT